jgi:hypothetical protein
MEYRVLMDNVAQMQSVFKKLDKKSIPDWKAALQISKFQRDIKPLEEDYVKGYNSIVQEFEDSTGGKYEMADLKAREDEFDKLKEQSIDLEVPQLKEDTVQKMYDNGTLTVDEISAIYNMGMIP